MIRLLIVDDSALMRRLLMEIFAATGDFEIAVARNGSEALELLLGFRPDVVTLDVHMPEMDGLACLDQIMLLGPCPVVMVSALTGEGADETLEALELGAVDFVAKPKGPISLEIDLIAGDLVNKVRAASKIKISRTTRLRERVRATTSSALGRRKKSALDSVGRRIAPAYENSAKLAANGIVIIGCSTGGPPALDAVLGKLQPDFPCPIVIAQHMPANFTGPLARRLDRMCAITVVEVTGAIPLLAGHAYIGMGDSDLILSRRRGQIVAMPAPSSPDHFWHPSVDRLVESAMLLLHPKQLLGVLLTGMGTDGAAAMAHLHAEGGITIAEDESTAIVWGMPGALVAHGGACCVIPLDAIADAVVERCAA